MAIHLGGSSRQSLVATSAALEAELKGVSADAAALLSNELFAVVNVLGANVALRRAITDPARSADDKAKLLGDIFLGKTWQECDGYCSKGSFIALVCTK